MKLRSGKPEHSLERALGRADHCQNGNPNSLREFVPDATISRIPPGSNLRQKGGLLWPCTTSLPRSRRRFRAARDYNPARIRSRAAGWPYDRLTCSFSENPWLARAVPCGSPWEERPPTRLYNPIIQRPPGGIWLSGWHCPRGPMGLRLNEGTAPAGKSPRWAAACAVAVPSCQATVRGAPSSPLFSALPLGGVLPSRPNAAAPGGVSALSARDDNRSPVR